MDDIKNKFFGPGVDIIKFYEDKIIDKLPESILDLGCNNSHSFYKLFAEYRNIKRYVGIDRECELGARDRFCDEQIEELKGTIPEFDAIAKFHYQTDMFDYFKNSCEKFDLVVLSNLLHLKALKSRWKEILLKAKERVHWNSLIYIQVFDQEHLIKDQKDTHSLFSIEELKELEGIGKVLFKKEMNHEWTFLIR